MVQAIKSAVGTLNALGLTSSYQNEGSAWETNWQDGKGHHILLTCIDLINPDFFTSSAFFGYKYNQLQQIKQKYDPNNCAFTEMVFFSDPDPVH
jgi:hypothetical protein